MRTETERARYNAKARSHPARAVWAKVRIRVQKGTLKRQPCVFCGCENGDAHHEDYAKPLEVVWVCQKHHSLIHAGKLKVLPEHISIIPMRAKRTHCRNGHPYSEATLYVRPDGERECRICRESLEKLRRKTRRANVVNSPRAEVLIRQIKDAAAISAGNER